MAPSFLSMKTRLILKQGQRGTKQLSEKYGNDLLYVRFRYDAESRLCRVHVRSYGSGEDLAGDDGGGGCEERGEAGGERAGVSGNYTVVIVRAKE